MSKNNEVMGDFIKAYDEWSDAIFRHCWFRIGNREKALDLVQDTFTKSWQYISQGKKVGNIKAFLFKVANNLIIDEYRKKKELSLNYLQDLGFDPEFSENNSLQDSIDARFVINKINQLDQKYSEVMLMKYVDDLSIEEIAEIVGESENNVSVRIHRAIKQLKELLNNQTQS